MYRRPRNCRSGGLLASVAGPVASIFFLAVVACSAPATVTPIPVPGPTEPPTALPKATPQVTASPTATPAPGPETTPTPNKSTKNLPDYWSPPVDYYGEPVYGGTLRINYEDPLEHANTWGAASGATHRFRMPTGAMLVMENPYDPDGDLLPDLAESWEVHDDQQGVTFHLRDNARWHNGEPFVCEDARFTFETMITGKGITSSAMHRRLANLVLEETKCLDNMTLRVRFGKPTAIPLLHFADRRTVVFNKKWFLEGGEDAMFRDVSMGIGPFKWAQGQEVGTDVQRFEKNPDYFIPGLPYVDGLVIHGILDEATQLATQLSHQTDWHWVRNWKQYQAYVDHEQILTVIRPTRSHFRLWIHPEQPPFENARIRQAIFMGIDRDVLIHGLQDIRGVKGGYGYRPGSKWELPNEARCGVPGWCQRSDVAAARAEARMILREEGFDFGKTYVFRVEPTKRARLRALNLMSQLAQLGIKSEITDPYSCYGRGCKLNEGHFLLTFNTMPADDPTEGVARYLSCESPYNYWTIDPQNTVQHCDVEIEHLLDRAETETDQAERLELAHRIELAAMRQYSSIPLYWEQEAAAFWPEIRGYAHFPTPSGSFLKFMHLWINPEGFLAMAKAGKDSPPPGSLETSPQTPPTMRPLLPRAYPPSGLPGHRPPPTPDFWTLVPNWRDALPEYVGKEVVSTEGIFVTAADDATAIAGLIMLMDAEQREQIANEAFLLNQQLRSSMKFSPWREVTWVWLDLLEAADDPNISFTQRYQLAEHRLNTEFYGYTPGYLPPGYKLAGSGSTFDGLGMFQDYTKMGRDEAETGRRASSLLIINQVDLRLGIEQMLQWPNPTVPERSREQVNTLEMEGFTFRYWLLPDEGAQGGVRIHAAWEDPDTQTLVQISGPITLEEATKVIEGLR